MSGGEPVGTDPASPRPPVGFRLSVPDDWLAVDLDPATVDRWVEARLDGLVAAQPDAARHRGHLRRLLQGLVEQHRAAGVLFAALLTAPAARPSDVVSASLTLAWKQLQLDGGMNVDGLAILLLEAEPDDGEDLRGRLVDRVDVPATPAVRVRSSMLVPVPETSRRQRVAVVQYYLPVPDTSWLGVLTVSTPNLGLAPVMTDLADRVAASLEYRTGADLPPRLGTIGFSGRPGPTPAPAPRPPPGGGT
jgi:hypothetical protein